MHSVYLSALKNLSASSFHQGVKKCLEQQLPLLSIIPSRNTYILRRKYPIKLNKKGYEDRKLKGKDYVYELVENTECRKRPEIPVILKQNLDGIGMKGECVSLKRNVAYNKLLVTGLADYATPEAIEEAKYKEAENIQEHFSSPYAPLTVKYLENLVLSVVMNKDVEWILEPWHLRVSFRKAGVNVPQECIILPDKPIKGPNLDFELKVFCITVVINNRERATVRCRLHHWSTDSAGRLPYVSNYWTLPLEPIFPEDSELIQSLPVIKYKNLQAEVQ